MWSPDPNTPAPMVTIKGGPPVRDPRICKEWPACGFPLWAERFLRSACNSNKHRTQSILLVGVCLLPFAMFCSSAAKNSMVVGRKEVQPQGTWAKEIGPSVAIVQGVNDKDTINRTVSQVLMQTPLQGPAIACQTLQDRVVEAVSDYRKCLFRSVGFYSDICLECGPAANKIVHQFNIYNTTVPEPKTAPNTTCFNIYNATQFEINPFDDMMTEALGDGSDWFRAGCRNCYVGDAQHKHVNENVTEFKKKHIQLLECFNTYNHTMEPSGTNEACLQCQNLYTGLWSFYKTRFVNKTEEGSGFDFTCLDVKSRMNITTRLWNERDDGLGCPASFTMPLEFRVICFILLGPLTIAVIGFVSTWGTRFCLSVYHYSCDPAHRNAQLAAEVDRMEPESDDAVRERLGLSPADTPPAEAPSSPVRIPASATLSPESRRRRARNRKKVESRIMAADDENNDLDMHSPSFHPESELLNYREQPAAAPRYPRPRRQSSRRSARDGNDGDDSSGSSTDTEPLELEGVRQRLVHRHSNRL